MKFQAIFRSWPKNDGNMFGLALSLLTSNTGKWNELC